MAQIFWPSFNSYPALCNENSHLRTLFQSVLPHLPWNVNRFVTVPKNHWKSIANQRKMFDEIGNALEVTSPDDWYSVTIEKVLRVEGSGGLLVTYKNSLSDALKAIYPEHEWKSYRFSATPHGLHESWHEVEGFIKDAEKKLRIKSSQDWYRVSQDMLWRLGGGQLVAMNGGLYQVASPLPVAFCPRRRSF